MARTRKIIIAVVVIGILAAINTPIYLSVKNKNDNIAFVPSNADNSHVLISSVAASNNLSEAKTNTTSTPKPTTSSTSTVTPTSNSTSKTDSAPIETPDSWSADTYYFCMIEMQADLAPIQARLDANIAQQNNADARVTANTSGSLVTEAQRQHLVTLEIIKLQSEYNHTLAEYNKVRSLYQC